MPKRHRRPLWMSLGNHRLHQSRACGGPAAVKDEGSARGQHGQVPRESVTDCLVDLHWEEKWNTVNKVNFDRSKGP
eukprot:3718414-Rhodomonas_salina.1